jgi:hypothetical protein
MAIPNEFLSIVTRCFHSNPDNRPTFAELLDALDKFIKAHQK